MWFCQYHWSQGTQWDELLLSPLCHSGNNLSPDVFSSLCQLCNGSPGEFSFSELSWPLISLHYCLLCCLLAAFRFTCGCHVHQWALNHLGFITPHITLEYAQWKAYVPPGTSPWPMPEVHWVAAPSTALSRGIFMFSSSYPTAITSIW